MVRRTAKMIILILFLIPLSVYAMDEKDQEKIIDKDKIIMEQMENLKIDELEDFIKNLDNDKDQYLPKIEFRKMLISLVKGEQVITAEKVLKGIFQILFKEVLANWHILAKIIVLSIICAVLTNLKNAFAEDAVGELAFYICYLVLIAFAIQSFILAMDIGKEAIDNMVIFMQALLPTLLTLLLAMGGLTSSALFQPVVLGAISVVSTLMKDIILPLIFFSAIISLISQISKKIQISNLAGLIRKITTGIIGVSLTVFIGIMSIQGATTAKVDGVTIRTAKFAVDKFVPIVGKFLSDAMDTVVGCSMLLKNAIGVIGLLVLFTISIFPIIKIVSLILIYKVSIAVIEPISNSRIIDALNDISKSLVLVLAAVMSVGLMFFIAITIIVGAGNVTIMLR